MEEDAIRSILRELIHKRTGTRELGEQELDDNVSLVDIGILDSFGFLELISELEEKIGVEPDFSEVEPDELTSINGLVRVVMGV